MDSTNTAQKKPWLRQDFTTYFLAFLVSANGIYILADTLIVQVSTHHNFHLNRLVIGLPLVIGLTLIYLGFQLRKRKQTAWIVSVLAYAFYLGVNIEELILRKHLENGFIHEYFQAIILPLVVVSLLISYRKRYIVKSDIQGINSSLKVSAIILLAAFIYGTAGFLLMDDSDFHTEFSLPTAMHYTVDQFNVTTSHPLVPHTERARLFLDTLSLVSTVAVIYALISLFQPLRARFSDHTAERTELLKLLDRYGGRSEEFFKVWPHDKQYFFSDNHESVLAFHSSNGVALCLGSPSGDKKEFKSLMTNFSNLCFGNDWLPAYAHIEDEYQELYDELGFSLQKIGQEAIVDLKHFQTETIKSKYFRQIFNRFQKNQYSYEILSPPHHSAVIDRLETISNEWLSKGGRDERGFAMGYFSREYIQLCRILVVRDAADTIQAFLNILPADFDKEEADFDMLRHSSTALGNVNDYLLISLIEKLSGEGYLRLNLGLCPLDGLKEEGDDTEKNSLINSFLAFAYANGDRFYSFQGLHRFKSKYEPEWRDRYVAYQGGLRGFTRTMTALMRAMRL